MTFDIELFHRAYEECGDSDDVGSATLMSFHNYDCARIREGVDQGQVIFVRSWIAAVARVTTERIFQGEWDSVG